MYALGLNASCALDRRCCGYLLLRTTIKGFSNFNLCFFFTFCCTIHDSASAIKMSCVFFVSPIPFRIIFSPFASEYLLQYFHFLLHLTFLFYLLFNLYMNSVFFFVYIIDCLNKSFNFFVVLSYFLASSYVPHSLFLFSISSFVIIRCYVEISLTYFS